MHWLGTSSSCLIAYTDVGRRLSAAEQVVDQHTQFWALACESSISCNMAGASLPRKFHFREQVKNFVSLAVKKLTAPLFWGQVVPRHEPFCTWTWCKLAVVICLNNGGCGVLSTAYQWGGSVPYMLRASNLCCVQAMRPQVLQVSNLPSSGTFSCFGCCLHSKNAGIQTNM